MKKSILAVVFVVIAAGVIAGGTWYANQLSNDSQQAAVDQGTATEQTQSQIMANLKIVDTKVGTGAEAQNGDSVTVNYTGTLDDGTKFDSSLNPGRTPFVFVLGAGRVIQGWDKGVLGMKVGGTRELTIPPELGYGAQGAGNGAIPPNSTLHFTVTLLSVSSTGQ